MDRRVVLFAGVSLASALLWFTGPSSTRAQQDQEVQDQEVQLREFAIEPATFTVAAGETVHLNVTNQGAREHNLELELESAGIDQVLFGANLQPGQSDTAEVTFSQPGTWELYCPLDQHRDRGMLASVQVQEASEAPVLQPEEPAPPAPATTVPTSVPAPPAPAPPPPPPPPRRGY
jgi:uncharacterized cupredoxin-like copper-binding protein